MASPLPRTLDVARSLASTLAQQGRGIATRPAGRQPAEPLELYDMEGCPFCRLVREALTDLDLDVLIGVVTPVGDQGACIAKTAALAAGAGRPPYSRYR